MSPRLVRLALVGLTVAAASFTVSPVGADSTPTGERQVGQAAIEPAYDDSTGGFTYLLTPEKAPNPSHANSHAVAPLYLVLYPSGSTVGTLNCEMSPDNCPDHNPAVAGAAMAIMPGVYGDGVLGHDHLVGIAKTGGDFNVAWQVVLVLFTSKDAANTHVTKLAQLRQLEQGRVAFEVPTSIVFNCSAVSASAYWSGAAIGG